MAYTFNDAALTAVTGDFAGNDYFGLDGANGPRKVLCSRFVLNDKSYADPAWITSLAASKVGLGSVENKSSATIRGEITSGNVTTALGFTPYNASNPSGYITSSALSPYLTTATAASTYQTTLVSGTSIKTINGNSVLGSGDITISASSVTNAAVITALGFTPYNSSNPSGYITSSSLSSYLPLSGGTLTGPLEISTGSTNNSYNEGLRLTAAGNGWAGVTFASTGLSGAPVNGWFAARNPSYQFMISPSSDGSLGLLLNNAGNALWRNNVILHAGNYTSYAPSLTGSGASGTWGINITGSAATATDSSKLPLSGGTMTGTVRITNNSIRSAASSGWDGDPGAEGKIQYHANRWYIVADSSSDRIVQFRRNGSDLSYIANSGAFIGDVSGTAGSISGYNNPATGATANTIVYRDGSGHITGNYFFGNYINTGDDVSTGSITYLMGKFGDNYHRSATAAKVAAFLSGQTMNINGSSTSCSGNAASASSVAWGNVSSKPGSIFYYAGWATDANTVASNSSSFCYSVNAAATGPLAYFEAGGYGLQLSCGYGDGSNFYWRVRNGDNGTWQTWRRFLTEDIWINNKHFGSDGNIYSNASMRAPIFFDQNDTAFYCDPNSTTRLNLLNVAQNLHVSVNGSTGGGIILADDGDIVDLNDAYCAMRFSYGVRIHSGNRSGGAVITLGSDGRVTANTDARAPIFYDSNDTYYSVDPNGTSRLANRLYLHDWIEFVNYSGLYSGNNGAHFYPNNASYGSWRVAGSRNGWAGLEFDASNGQQSMMVSTGGNTIGWHNNSYGWKFFWESGRMYCYDSTYGGGPQRMLLMQDTWQGSKYFGSDGAMYGTILYDSNNSGYYCDPNGTSRMGTINADTLNSYGTIAAYYSDDRLKTRFNNIGGALDMVCSLNGFFYEANETAEKLGYKKKREVGLSAQEVQRILPEIISPAPIDEQYMTIQYDRVVPLLVEAIKELRLELNQLKSLVKL